MTGKRASSLDNFRMDTSQGGQLRPGKMVNVAEALGSTMCWSRSKVSKDETRKDSYKRLNSEKKMHVWYDMMSPI